MNKILLIGNLGRDPELRSVGNGAKVVLNFSMATKPNYMPKDRTVPSNWHNIVVWGKNAERLGSVLKKGSRVFVEGEMTCRSYEAKDGTKKYVYEVVAASAYPLEGLPASRAAQSPDSDAGGVGVGEDIPY